MKFNYKFQNLLGTIYKKGDVVFTPDGNCVISPVGNRITIYNLKQNKSHTLSTESCYNYRAVDVAPNGAALLAVNEKGEAHMISLVTSAVVHRYKFKSNVNCVKFSPDGKYFAALCDNTVFIMTAPCDFTGEFRSFAMKRVFRKNRDDVVCADWSDCSRVLAVGSKDCTTKLFTVDYLENFSMYSMGGHTDPIVGCFFEKGSLDLITVSRNGQICLWESTIDADDLEVSKVQLSERKKRKLAEKDEDSEDDLDEKKALEKGKDDEALVSDDEETLTNALNKEGKNKLHYKKLGRHYIADSIKKDNPQAKMTAAKYHKQSRVLVTGFSVGIFLLHEMPDVNLIHSLNMSEHKISTIAISQAGDWIAFGCPHIGQLLVWEWQSEQYVMKQQGHSQNMTCLSYSPDGQFIVTGGHDGKVKVWNVSTSFCFVTFSEHSSTVTGISFSPNKKFVATSSLDGTVRCFDLSRYRNFRTMTSDQLVQFSCVALDSSSELCAAGTQDSFNIYVWSVQFGKVLEILSGHEAPVSSVCFSPVLSNTQLVSASWDKTLRIWNCIEKGSEHETIQLNSDALCAALRPDGEEVAVTALDGSITFFNVKSSEQTGSIEGRFDLESGLSDTDLVTAKQLSKAKAFTTICYSADGTCVLAGGNSKFICLYGVKETILLKKYVITQNRSLDAVNDFINRRLLTEFGNAALIEERSELEGGDQALRLPGVKAGDMADRNVKPEVRVLCVRFSPTGESFAVAATEGLIIYGQGAGIDGSFRPYKLSIFATPSNARALLKKREWGDALVAALQLNQHELIQQVIESVPPAHIKLTATTLDAEYSNRLLITISILMENSPHLEHMLTWTRHLISVARKDFPLSCLLALEKVMTRKYGELANMCDFNKYSLRCLKSVCGRSATDRKQELEEMEDMDLDGDNALALDGLGRLPAPENNDPANPEAMVEDEDGSEGESDSSGLGTEPDSD